MAGLLHGKKMIKGHFYFIKDEFYEALSDCNLMSNKEVTQESMGGRPCHYCIEYNGLYWLIPISSKVDKYKRIYDQKVKKRGRCDTLRFGYVNGKERAFLIQNSFPITAQYVDNEYRIQNGTVAVQISEDLAKELDSLMRKVIRLYENGITLPLTNITKIIEFLNIN